MVRYNIYILECTIMIKIQLINLRVSPVGVARIDTLRHTTHLGMF